MPIVLFNALLAAFCLLLQSNIFSAYHIYSFSIHVPIVATAAALAASAPFTPLAISMLWVAAFADSLSSGIPNLHMLLTMITFLVMSALASRFRIQNLVSMLVLTALATLAFNLAYGMILSIQYSDSTILTQIPLALWRDTLASVVAVMPYAYVLSKFNDIWQKRSQNAMKTSL